MILLFVIISFPPAQVSPLTASCICLKSWPRSLLASNFMIRCTFAEVEIGNKGAGRCWREKVKSAADLNTSTTLR